jgi:hypothetical protein
MQRSHSRYVVSTFVTLLAILACALPGQTVQPAPVNDPNAISTAVAGTAHAAEQQTQQANPAPATATVAPTDVLTPTPKISVSRTSLSIREDQSTLFTDYKAGIQVIIPAGWMALRINEEEYLKAFDSDVVLQNPDINERLTIIRDANPDIFRLDAIDIRPGHIHDGLISDIMVVFEEGDIRSLEKWEQAERNRFHPQANFKFISASYPQLSNGMRILVIEQTWNANGGKNTAYYRGVFFGLPTGTIVLDFQTNFDVKDTILLDFDQVVNSLTLISPQ